MHHLMAVHWGGCVCVCVCVCARRTYGRKSDRRRKGEVRKKDCELHNITPHISLSLPFFVCPSVFSFFFSLLVFLSLSLFLSFSLSLSPSISLSLSNQTVLLRPTVTAAQCWGQGSSVVSLTLSTLTRHYHS